MGQFKAVEYSLHDLHVYSPALHYMLDTVSGDANFSFRQLVQILCEPVQTRRLIPPQNQDCFLEDFGTDCPQTDMGKPNMEVGIEDCPSESLHEIAEKQYGGGMDQTKILHNYVSDDILPIWRLIPKGKSGPDHTVPSKTPVTRIRLSENCIGS
ncbi:hypothetical protein ACJ73_04054 [Blastomyces percursus]|uniref:Uncharacterized protein n=1 Tax=Blastomyces percursus TaxID=1658174 RepID=A0A1J9Q937_9EURO|nr:hypothetical protein ACJ73_04054 [Blastomyces percursus]